MARGARSAPCGACYLHNVCSREAAPAQPPSWSVPVITAGQSVARPAPGAGSSEGGPGVSGRETRAKAGGEGGRGRLAAVRGTLLPGARRCPSPGLDEEAEPWQKA